MKGRVALLVLVALAGCDAGPEATEDVLVVEAFFDVGEPLPGIRVQRTASADGAYPGAAALAVTDAQLVVLVDDTPLPYSADPARAGWYVPETDAVVVAEARYRVEVTWHGQQVRAETRTPPRLDVSELEVLPFEAPIRAVLLDSLRFDTLATGARQGFVYPVEVRVTWPSVPADTLLWMRTQLRPAQGFSSTVVDFFFPPERILPEAAFEGEEGRRSWRGLYVLPVDSATAPLPAHRVRIALVRSGQDYARFAATRTSPARREPRSNVAGGRGIVAGVSVDSTIVVVDGLR